MAFAWALLLLFSASAFALTSVSSENCSVVYTIRLAFTGNGSSPEFIQRVRDAVNDEWNKNFTCGDCACKARIELDTISVANCAAAPPNFHCVNVVNTSGIDHRSWVRMGRWGAGGLPTNRANWSSSDSNKVIAHEVGHYLGLDDEYEDYICYWKINADGTTAGPPNPIYVKKSEMNPVREAQNAADAPPGGSIEYCTKPDGVTNYTESRPKTDIENDSLMTSVDALAHVFQRHMSELCNRSGAQCADSCCCGNAVVEPLKGEQCEQALNPPGCAQDYACNPLCVCEALYYCGNGFVDSNESCDSSSALPNGGCMDYEICMSNCTCERNVDWTPPAGDTTGGNDGNPPPNDSNPPPYVNDTARPAFD